MKIYFLVVVSVLLSGCIIETIELQTEYTKIKTSCGVTSYEYNYKNNFLGTDYQVIPASYRPYKDEVWSSGWIVGKEDKGSITETYDLVKLSSPDDIDFTIIDTAIITYISESNLTLNYSLRRNFSNGYKISKINCITTRY